LLHFRYLFAKHQALCMRKMKPLSPHLVRRMISPNAEIDGYNIRIRCGE